jgi:hypothetical protein
MMVAQQHISVEKINCPPLPEIEEAFVSSDESFLGRFNEFHSCGRCE